VTADVPSTGVVEGSIGRATSEMELAQAGGERRAMTYIGFKNSAGNSRVYARMNGEAKYQVRKEGDSLVVIEIQNATIPLRNNKNHLDATFFDSPVKMITPSEIEDATPTIRITIEMKQAAPFEHKREGNEIVVTFKK
jgi:colicin import membrane protein